MTKFESPINTSWAPTYCTLPTVEQPLRQQQFDELFADAVTAVQRINPAAARLTLHPEPQFAARAAELSTRESGCCSFLTFVLTVTEGVVMLDISAPPAQVDVLDALTERARAASSAGAA